MGLTTHVEGFRPPDETFDKMLAAYRACEAADVAVPDPVDDFFDGSPPDPRGVSVDVNNAVSKGPEDTDDSHEVDLKKLPAGVTVIRFTNSW